MIRRTKQRRGTTVVECAVVVPLFLLLMIGLIVGCLGVFRYQELASLAREAARYASVRGAKYAQATGNPAATPQDIYDNAIKSRAVLLDLDQLSYEVTWSPDNRQGGVVTVTVNYNWVPEVYFQGVTMTSSSAMPVSY